MGSFLKKGLKKIRKRGAGWEKLEKWVEAWGRGPPAHPAGGKFQNY
jgi:hypothetical protein